ncbi:MAG: hypothetical protein JSW27_09490 [Phycisphaerales bacterium]|nr:MAG: hypothetical protein JSW27_09490 [Phycisphaerales bacterium]
MSFKRAVFVLLVAGLVLAMFSVSRAVVDLRRIKEVHGKSVLTQQDMQVIDEFMQDAVEDLVRTTDFTQISKIRATILTYQSPQAQYAQQYSESALTHITAGLQEARADIRDENTRFKVIANLLILIDSLKDPRLVNLAIGEIKHPNNAVRYWAVRVVSDSDLWGKLSQNQAAASQLAGRILAECSQAVEGSSPEVLRLMAEFAGRFDTAQAERLLAQVADARIASYADWSVTYELMDGAVLGTLCEKLTAGGTAKPELAKRFGQLLSFVMQRYIKGQGQGTLPNASANYLVSVMIDTEEKCLGRLLGTPQVNLRRAIEAGDLNALQAEHDRLLGAGSQAGALSSKLSISYGPEGQSQAAPLALPPQPQSSASAPPNNM